MCHICKIEKDRQRGRERERERDRQRYKNKKRNWNTQNGQTKIIGNKRQRKKRPKNKGLKKFRYCSQFTCQS